MASQDLVTHECAPAFAVDIFRRYLPMYTVHELEHEHKPGKTMTLSQHMFGWPAHRPRRYTVLTRNETCELPEGLTALRFLFRKPRLSVECFMCAPKAGAFNELQFLITRCPPPSHLAPHVFDRNVSMRQSKRLRTSAVCLRHRALKTYFPVTCQTVVSQNSSCLIVMTNLRTLTSTCALSQIRRIRNQTSMAAILQDIPEGQENDLQNQSLFESKIFVLIWNSNMTQNQTNVCFTTAVSQSVVHIVQTPTTTEVWNEAGSA